MKLFFSYFLANFLILAIIVILFFISNNVQIQSSSLIYYNSALNFLDFLKGNTHISEVVWRPPLYPFLLSVIIYLFKIDISLNYFPLLLFNILTFIFVTFLTMKISHRLCKNINPIYLNWLVSFVYIFHIYNFAEPYSLRETHLYTLLILLSFYFFLSIENNNKYSFLVGFFIGLASLTRPNGFILLIIIIFIYLTYFQNFKIIDKIKIIFYLFIGYIFTISIWLIPVSIFTSNQFLTSSCSTGYNMFFSYHQSFDNLYLYADIDAGIVASGIIEFIRDKKLYCDHGNHLRDLALKSLFDRDILFILKNFFTKFVVYFMGSAPFGYSDVIFSDGNNIVKNFKFNYNNLIYSFICLFFVSHVFYFFFISFFKRDKETSYLNFCVYIILGHAFIYSATWPEMRFKFPIDPFIIIVFIKSMTNQLKNFKQ